MFNINKTTRFFLYLLFLSPFISYITRVLLGLQPFIFYLKFFIFFYGSIFICLRLNKNLIPGFANFALLWLIYLLSMPLLIENFKLWNSFGRLHTHLPIFMILIIIYNTRFRDTFISNIIFVFKITVIITFIVSIIQFFDPRFLFMREISLYVSNIYIIRRTSIFGFEHNALGLSFIPLLSVLVGYMVYQKNRFMIYFLFMGGIIAFLSNSRYVMVGFFIILLQVFLASKDKIKGLVKYALITGIVLIVSIQSLLLLGYDIEMWQTQRLFKERSLVETTRYKAIDTFMIFFPKNALLGNGFISDELVKEASRAVGSSHIHVGYLSHLVAYGAVGCFFLYGFWILLAIRLFRTARQTNYWGSFFAFLVFLWSFATFSQSSILYGGIIFALVFDKYFSDRNTEINSHNTYRYKT